MIDWTASRIGRLTYRKVDFPSFIEGEDLYSITGGSLTFSNESELYVDGSLTFSGDSVPNGMLRIYYGMLTDDGWEDTPIATLFAVKGNANANSVAYNGSVTVQSVLRVLARKKYGRPFVVQKNANAVQLAIDICTSVGLDTNGAQSDVCVQESHVFKAEDSYLTIVNWLMSSAGFSNVYVDPIGTVVMAPSTSTLEKSPVWVFEEGESCIFEPNVALSDGIDDVPNALRVSCDLDVGTVWAACVNNDTSSDVSISNLGYEITEYESIDEVSGGTIYEKVDSLKNVAQARYLEILSECHVTEISHLWVPVFPNDPVRLLYGSANISKNGVISNMSLTLGSAMRTVTRIGTSTSPDIKLTTSGGYL